MTDIHKDNQEVLNSLKASQTTSSNPLYAIEDNRIVWMRSPDTKTVLCNFTAKITSEEVRDDGARKEIVFVIDGKTHDGKTLPPAICPSNQYASMSWINAEWGTRAIIYAGQAIKDHLRVAILSLSGEVARRTIYAHFGWRKISDKWVFLHASGAIGALGSDSTVHIAHTDGKLSSYSLPDPPEGVELIGAINASLSMLELAPDKISVPLLAAIYRAPLGESSPSDFSLFLSGPSGSKKSEKTAMAQAHFGREFERKNLPGNWASTANALERQSFLAKDVIYTIDDFAPTGTAVDVNRLHKDAERILRGQGNKAGRERLTSDVKARPQYYPRGIIISSGEDIPRGSSIRARTLILELNRESVNEQRLTGIQGHAAAGTLAKSMSGYIQWLAPKIESLKKVIPERQAQMRNEVDLGLSHARTPDIIISLRVGLEHFLQYAYEKGAIDTQKKEELLRRCWKALKDAGGAQMEYQSGEDPTSKFLELLAAAIVSGKAHLAHAKNGGVPPDQERWGWHPQGNVIRSPNGESEPESWQAKGDKVGWIDGDELLLHPGAAYSVAQKVARDQNDSIPISPNTLWKRLVQKGIASKNDPKKNVSKRTVEGNRQSVLVIPDKEVIYGVKIGEVGEVGSDPSKIKPSRPQNLPLESGGSENWGQKIGTENRNGRACDPSAPTSPKNTTHKTQIYGGIQ